MNKNILITGVSTGIGRATAVYFLQNGYRVFGSVRNRPDADQFQDNFGQSFVPLVFDVSHSRQIDEAAQYIRTNYSDLHLDCLINNAGIAIPGPMEEMSESQFQKQMDVNITGVFRVTKTFLPYLKRSDAHSTPGKILNISSISGLISSPFNGAYCISKHALESMCDVYRRELKVHDIDVISILPGPIKTRIWAKNIGGLDQYSNGAYSSLLSKADEIILKTEKAALPVEVIATKIFNIVRSTNNKTRYIIHKKPLFIKLVSWLPDRILDRIIWKNFKSNTTTDIRGI